LACLDAAAKARRTIRKSDAGCADTRIDADCPFVISETPRRRITWVDDKSGAPRPLGTAETTRLYLGRIELARPGGDRRRASFWFAWPVQTNYRPKPGTLIRVKICVMRSESSDSAAASFDLGVDDAGSPIFKEVKVPFES
jgi:hypothetical protein